MKTTIYTLICLVLLLSAAPAALAQDYLLAHGDVLTIGVWGFEDLQVKEIMIRPDGKIAFPLAGEVQAAGVSPGALGQQLTTLLSQYVKDPKVAVNVVKFRTTRVYVLGEVAKPGMYDLEKSYNLLDAVSAAGGYTKDTAKKKIFIVRKDNPGQPIQTNLLNLLEKADMSQNHPLYDGDVVYLTKNNRFDFGRDLLPFLTGAYYIDAIQNRK